MTRDERLLTALHDRQVNYDVDAPHDAAHGWRHDHYCEWLPSEAPGEPVEGGPFRIAQQLLRNYQVADPRIVRAHYDPEAPLEGRDMLLEIRFGPIRIPTGCRVGQVIDEEREVDGHPVRVWGWPYRTLEGHIERGEMSWEVWKWLDSGRVQFHVHSYMKAAPRNPIVDLGFRIFGQWQRRRYLQGACRRMARFTTEALARGGAPEHAGAPR